MADLTKSMGERQGIAETSRRNAEAVRALGMHGFLSERFATANERHVQDALQASDAAAGIGAFAKIFRMILQSGALGLGAYLVIRNEMSPGAMIAAF